MSQYNHLNKDKKIVLCHGVFDVLHSGHLKYLSQAKKLGDVLVVSVTADKFVNKGPLRPLNSLQDRIVMLKNLKCVNYVVPSYKQTAVEIIKKIKPNIYCKGPDYKNKILEDKKLIKEVSVLKKNQGIFFTVDHFTRSSSKIINQLTSGIKIDSEIFNFLKKIKKNYSNQDIKNFINKLSTKKILILGEVILDKYIFVDAVGKSGKDSILIYKEKGHLNFLGGTGYVANLISNFSDTFFIFHIGKIDSQLDFIKKNLNKKIKYFYLSKEKSPTITKLRYLDDYKKNKIIGFYKINDQFLSLKEESKYLSLIKKIINKVSNVVIVDYGHGELTSSIIKFLCKYPRKISLNTQINSFNYKYHTMKKYKKVNILCMNESELRHELRDAHGSLKVLSINLKKIIQYKYLIITRGKFGSVLFYRNEIYECPAFNKYPVDTVGSGDTFFSLISLCLSNDTPPLISLLIASLSAAHSVKNIGNRDIFSANDLNKSIDNLFL